MDRAKYRCGPPGPGDCLRFTRKRLRRNGLMRISRMGMGTRARAFVGGGITALSLAVFSATPSWAQDLMGQPTPGGIGPLARTTRAL